MSRPGDVIHAYLGSIYPPKNKYLICICEDPLLFFPINTEFREHYDCIEISHKTYPALKGITRYISCSKVFTAQESPALWHLTQDDLLRVFHKVQDSKRLSNHVKTLLAKSLPQA